MAIFSFRPAHGAPRRHRSTEANADWAETRPAPFAHSDSDADSDADAFGDSAPRRTSFATDPSPPALSSLPPRAPAASSKAAARALAASVPLALPAVAPPTLPDVSAAFGGAGDARPDPGFAKALTARAHNDDLLGAGWYISSWDLMQGCDVVEGTPIDLLPPEWQRKRPRL